MCFFQFIKNISKQDDYLKLIPSYESALSQVLCEIRIARRKFMPKAQVVNYASQLTKVTTSMLDYLTFHKYPKSWPDSLKDFEIVIESYTYSIPNAFRFLNCDSSILEKLALCVLALQDNLLHQAHVLVRFWLIF